MEYDNTRIPENWNAQTWEGIFRSVVSWTVQPGEDIDDILAGTYILAKRRSELLGRKLEFWQDVPYVLSLFCWWPWKPSLSIARRQYLFKIRAQLFRGAASDENVLNGLMEMPSDMLTMNAQGLFDQLREIPTDG